MKLLLFQFLSLFINKGYKVINEVEIMSWSEVILASCSPYKLLVGFADALVHVHKAANDSISVGRRIGEGQVGF
jgi:hypothetical protein